ncbi:TIGR03619 family F420-dependent LLM class oxidoreductase [Herbidospora sp. NBRC 101105]|uniref:TIGR03619 family F420-dependent LLM class oxidoreductase n=1 Tax=Herbidospora sp. NBRC 101105 TaxID=3032195 RepID=UPI0024A379C9|nr:TIGR03619 family F420-dependent LLM class oxidoreductase [Herbidospora sp. NBRC 101105]GLX99283.1 LLM class F420-dependent oxidoreductase [Herbidospora sp. NBRC 101105]
MRLGLGLPSLGHLASPAFIASVARRAEELGYHSLWVGERLLDPVKPRSRYPGTPDGNLPESMKIAYDPVATLTFAAAVTSRITLGTSVLCMLLHNPVVLAKQLATLDALSGGRLRAGLGQGWSLDEIEAAGNTPVGQGRRSDEFVAVLRGLWTAGTTAYTGEFFTVPETAFEPKPASPRIYLGVYAPRAVERAGRLADGWLPGGLPLELLLPLRETLFESARKAGRPEPEVVVRANVRFTGTRRRPFQGTWAQIEADLAAFREAGVDEVFLDFVLDDATLTEEGFVERMERAARM